MACRRVIRLAMLALGLLAGSVHARAQEAGPRGGPADALRILVPMFSGEQGKDADLTSRVISMTLYFEILKAFADPGGAERGAWILYGQHRMPELSHRTAESEAAWPSIRADLVFWGSIVELGDDIVIEPRVTRTSISRLRNVQPEFLNVAFEADGGPIDLSIANSSSYFDLPPLAVPVDIIKEHADFQQGMPIYAGPDDPQPAMFINDAVYFQRITEEAAYVRFRGQQHGWIRFPDIPRDDLTMIDYGRGLIQVLRGDWAGAERLFSELAVLPSLPNALRVDANIYLGIAREKLGADGLGEFRQAWELNSFDRDAASFLMLGLVDKARERRDLLAELDEVLEASEVLFPKGDPWLGDLRRAADTLR